MIRIPTSKMLNIFVDVCQDIVYAYGWPSRLVRPIWKVKRAPKRAYPSFRRFLCAIAHHLLGDQDYDVKNAKFFRGRPSRPCLCIRLAITPFSSHLEGQTSPEASIPLISTIFVCYRKPFVLWSGFRCQQCQKILWTSVKNFLYKSGCPSRPVRPILKVKRAPKRAYPSFRWFSCAIAHHFWVIRIPTSKMPKFFVYVCEDLGYAAICPSRPIQLILKIKRA